VSSVAAGADEAESDTTLQGSEEEVGESTGDVRGDAKGVALLSASFGGFGIDPLASGGKELDFQEVERDDTSGAYAGPQWMDLAETGEVEEDPLKYLDGTVDDPSIPYEHSYPLSYYRSTKSEPAYITVTPVFTYESGAPIKCVLKGSGDGYTFGPIGVSAADGVISITLTANQALTTKIDSSELKISWYLSTDGGDTYTQVGTSDNHLFVTGARASEATETALWLGCQGAKGTAPADHGTPDNQAAPSNQAVVDGVWSQFSGDNVIDVEGDPLLYWGPQAINDPTPGLGSASSYVWLLEHKDGRCGSWASLLVNVLAIEGINSHEVEIDPNTLNQPTLQGFSKAYDLSKLKFTVYANDPGQNQAISHSTVRTFSNHAVVRIDSPVVNLHSIYDPSYGKMFSGATDSVAQLAWESASIESVTWPYLDTSTNTIVAKVIPDNHNAINPEVIFGN
jgi:hypothetical protein